MANERPPKRERQKQRRDEKRRAQAEEAARRRRNRALTLGVITGILVLGLAAIVFLATRTDEPATTASPDAVTDTDPDATSDPGSDADPAAVACGGETPETAEEEKSMFDAPQQQDLDPEATTIWRLETSCGTIDVELATADAPETTNSIAFLTRQGFFDGLTFHRVVPGFVIQGGDPEGTGTGGPGYQVTEPPPEGITYGTGMVAMAKANPDPPGTSGSQFFIVSGDAGSLPADFALVGEVVSGMDAVGEIEALGTGDGPPSETVYIEQATIEEGG